MKNSNLAQLFKSFAARGGISVLFPYWNHQITL
jgi:hypothetical protein